MNVVLKLLDHGVRWLLVLLMTAMVLAVTWQVVSRYMLASPSSWTEEVARFVLIWIGMLGAAYAFRTRMHIGLDLLPAKLTGAAARRLRRITAGLIMLFALTVLVVGGGSLVHLTWELRQTSAALGLPIAFVYSVMPLSGILIMLYSAAALSATVDEPPDQDPA